MKRIHRNHLLTFIGILTISIAVTQMLSVRKATALTFMVTTTADNDVVPPVGSLRKAILDANANAGLDTIQFNIGGGGLQTIIIDPNNGLPAITSPVIIDGYTQGGSSVNTGTTTNNAIINIVLDGSSLLVPVNGGLFLSGASSGSIIKGLVIRNFPGNGIRIDSSNNKVQGCYIGISNVGVSQPNDNSGVLVNNTDNNLIGTDGDATNDLAEKNVLSGNSNHGVRIAGVSATGNIVKGNFIGVGIDGVSDRGNTLNGVDIDQAFNNIIGGTTANERNIISGNDSEGVEIHGGTANGNIIQGNYIGTFASGTGDRGNTANGVLINGVGGNTVGGTTATPGTGAGNVISGNNSDGVEISGDAADSNTVAGNILGLNAAGTADFGNNGSGVFINGGDINTIGGTTTTARNIISGNGVQGVRLESIANNNLIKANFIGTNAAGTAAIGNSQGGVLLLTDCLGNTIGGSVAAERNIISGNMTVGIEINASAGNFVRGNYIGTDVNGNADLGNSTDGILINNVLSGSNNVIGGVISTPGTGVGNVISGNNSNGIEIVNTISFLTGQVQGNIIGLNAAGAIDLGNTNDGVRIINSVDISVGGSASTRNIISGNNLRGIEIIGTSTSTFVQGNFIGTDITGTLDRGNSNQGVLILGPNGNTVGGAGGARNVISGNSTGIRVDNLGGTGNLVQNNFIGTDVNGTNPVGNAGRGLEIAGPNNTVGGGSGLGNVIAFNGDDGVEITSSGATGNAIFANSIFSNGNMINGLGIDLGVDGVTPNDPLDFDLGENNLQNFPVLTSAILNSGNNTTTILGSLDSTPSTDFVLQFFSNPTCDTSGNGEGTTYLGSTTVHTTFDGNPVSFVIAFPTAVPVGQFITATATNSGLNTSEFSACQLVTGDAPTTIEFASASATSFNDGVFIQWRTGMEVNNLGFDLYRDNGGKLELINRQLIGGSALLFASEIELRSGQSYQWWDSSPADRSTAYWIEDRDLNGHSSWHGPFYPSPGSEKERPARIEQSKTLALLGVKDSPSTPVESLARLPGAAPSFSSIKTLALLPTPNQSGAVKIAIKREGWYRLTQAELVAAGLSKLTDPRLLQLFVDGREQAISVSGQEDGSFDPSDSIDFYATGIDSPFSDTRTYYLAAGKQAGLRVSHLKSFASPQRSGSFPCTVQRRDRTIYFAALLNGNRENFFGSVIASQPVNQLLSLQHVDVNYYSPALLRVSLQGVTNVEHVVTIELNGSFAGSIPFSSMSSAEITISIPPSTLQEGSNTVRLRSLGGLSDVSLVDSIQLTYQHTFDADDNALSFTSNAGESVSIGGFTDSAIHIFDVTDPYAVAEIDCNINKFEDQEGRITSIVSFTSPGEGLRSLLAVADSRVKHPDRIAADNPSNIRGTVQPADLVIVTSRQFLDQAELLKSSRRAQGLTPTIVDIEDIYDEFSFGQSTPYALRDFLSFANRTWRTRYALLLGDSSFDPKNYLGLGFSDFVPTKLLDTAFMETASDDWLADFDQNGIADFAIGRLPAQSASDAVTMIEKIFVYEKAQISTEALLVSDRNEGFNFELTNARLIPLLPQGTTATHLRRAVIGDPGTNAAVIDSINRGQRIVSYAGHGSANAWRGNTLTTTDAAALQNRERLTMFLILNCLNGYFHNPASESLAEALMRNSNGGAVAAWASSALTFADGQVSLSQEFYRQVFAGSARIGDAAIRAKASTLDPDVRRTWILFGDPTMRVK